MPDLLLFIIHLLLFITNKIKNKNNKVVVVVNVQRPSSSAHVYCDCGDSVVSPTETLYSLCWHTLVTTTPSAHKPQNARSAGSDSEP